MGLLIRSWNLFHGKTAPPGRRAYLEEMVRLASSDRPDVVCLQEVPVWATTQLERWSGMTAVTDVAVEPTLPAWLARSITDLHNGFFRAAFTGQANATLVAPQHRVLEQMRLVLNHGIPRALPRIPFMRERRVCQVVRIELVDKRTLLVGNLHASEDTVAADSETLRAAEFLEAVGKNGEPIVLAGDFNLRAHAPALGQLTAPGWGFSPPGEGIDHILVRGTKAEPLLTWPLARRSENGRVLSDHAPVELRIG